MDTSSLKGGQYRFTGLVTCIQLDLRDEDATTLAEMAAQLGTYPQELVQRETRQWLRQWREKERHIQALEEIGTRLEPLANVVKMLEDLHEDALQRLFFERERDWTKIHPWWRRLFSRLRRTVEEGAE